MSKNRNILSLLALLGVATFSLFLMGGSSVLADEASTENDFGGFTTRIAEILGVEESVVDEAVKQAHEEGYHLGRGNGMKMGTPFALESCLDIDSEELRDLFQASEGKTMSEVLTELGVEDLETVKECVVEDRFERIDLKVEEGLLDGERGEEIKEEIEEHMEDFLAHEVGSRKGDVKGHGFGRGVGRRTLIDAGGVQ